MLLEQKSHYNRNTVSSIRVRGKLGIGRNWYMQDPVDHRSPDFLLGLNWKIAEQYPNLWHTGPASRKTPFP